LLGQSKDFKRISDIEGSRCTEITCKRLVDTWQQLDTGIEGEAAYSLESPISIIHRQEFFKLYNRWSIDAVLTYHKFKAFKRQTVSCAVSLGIDECQSTNGS